MHKSLIAVCPLVVVPSVVLCLGRQLLPDWMTMWALALSIFACLKWLTWFQAITGSGQNAGSPLQRQSTLVWRSIAYLIAWPGMNAKSFLYGPPLEKTDKPMALEWSVAFANIFIGITLLWGVASGIPQGVWHLKGWTGLVGTGMVLHFGLFRLLSCLWRSVGIAAPPIMMSPIASARLSEFWGKRWNTAFRDLTLQFVFKPLLKHLDPKLATLIGFFVSGIVHDLVISAPPNAGYGLPTIYFLIQGLGVSVERSLIGKACKLEGGWQGRLYAICFIIIPAPLLFHKTFITDIILPYMNAIGI